MNVADQSDGKPVEGGWQIVDRNLDKISHSGMGSLTPEERKTLDDASKRFRQN